MRTGRPQPPVQSEVTRRRSSRPARERRAQPAQGIRQRHDTERLYELRGRQPFAEFARTALDLDRLVPDGVARKREQRALVGVQPRAAEMRKDLLRIGRRQALGFEEARELAKSGASVSVNDTGSRRFENQ